MSIFRKIREFFRGPQGFQGERGRDGDDSSNFLHVQRFEALQQQLREVQIKVDEKDEGLRLLSGRVRALELKQ